MLLVLGLCLGTRLNCFKLEVVPGASSWLGGKAPDLGGAPGEAKDHPHPSLLPFLLVQSHFLHVCFSFWRKRLPLARVSGEEMVPESIVRFHLLPENTRPPAQQQVAGTFLFPLAKALTSLCLGSRVPHGAFLPRQRSRQNLRVCLLRESAGSAMWVCFI